MGTTEHRRDAAEADESAQTIRLANVIRRLGTRSRLPALMPDGGAWHPGIDEELGRVSLEWLSGGRTDAVPEAAAYLAALHLWNDSLTRAHDLVERLGTPTAMLLHGIIHRREGDFDNANYWFRRTGSHPAYHGLQARAAAYLGRHPIANGPTREAAGKIATQGSWNPYLFVTAAAMQAYRIGDDEARERLEYVQQLELEAVMRFLEGHLGALRDD
ncbi:hypothetical protein [Cohnella hongkongensis]|uniref:Uncharacterized protein n=1 Tax=Cohnella hongkongensis TaxID=178337 RepID=A0ABV9FKZ9_9BACL